jgi:hypothetical protein
MSLLEPKVNGELNKNLRNLVVKVSFINYQYFINSFVYFSMIILMKEW